MSCVTATCTHPSFRELPPDRFPRTQVPFNIVKMPIVCRENIFRGLLYRVLIASHGEFGFRYSAHDCLRIRTVCNDEHLPRRQRQYDYKFAFQVTLQNQWPVRNHQVVLRRRQMTDFPRAVLDCLIPYRRFYKMRKHLWSKALQHHRKKLSSNVDIWALKPRVIRVVVADERHRVATSALPPSFRDSSPEVL